MRSSQQITVRLLLFFTSGTTSEPRGVVLTHGNFLANLEPLEQGIEEYRKYERWVHPLRFVSLVPLSHVFGQFMTLFVPPLLGATVVFENSPHPSEILRTLKRERATALIAVPRMLDALRNALEQEIDARGWREWFTSEYAAADGESFLRRVWRFRRLHRRLGWKFWAFISGGAALSTETEAFFKHIGYAVVQGYGMTETASLISLNHPFHVAQGSVGKILPGREFRLAEDGEILVRGENVAASYWQGGAMRDAAQENDGWLRTGDLGELDADGNLRFRGRKKSVIITPAGLNIYPEDLETALRKQPAIRDAVVIPIDCGGNAEPCAVLLPGGTAIPGCAPGFFFSALSSLLFLPRWPQRRLSKIKAILHPIRRRISRIDRLQPKCHLAKFHQTHMRMKLARNPLLRIRADHQASHPRSVTKLRPRITRPRCGASSRPLVTQRWIHMVVPSAPIVPRNKNRHLRPQSTLPQRTHPRRCPRAPQLHRRLPRIRSIRRMLRKLLRRTRRIHPRHAR